MKLTKLMVSALALSAIAGCASPFDKAQDLYEALGNGYPPENFDPLAPADMPEGRAKMEGVFAGTTLYNSPNEMYIGDLEMTADFDADTIDGTVDDVREYELANVCLTDGLGASGCSAEELQRLDGSLDMTGTIAGNTFLWDATGDLSGEFNGSETTAELDLEGEGEFGTVDGDLTAIGRTTAGSTITIDGVPTQPFGYFAAQE